MQNNKRNGRKLGTNTQRIERLENKVEWLVGDAFQTLANSVAEQASACQAMLKLLAELHPDRRMVKCATEDGRVFYEFKLISEIEAAKENGATVEIMEAEKDAEVQQAKH